MGLWGYPQKLILPDGTNYSFDEPEFNNYVVLSLFSLKDEILINPNTRQVYVINIINKDKRVWKYLRNANRITNIRERMDDYMKNVNANEIVDLLLDYDMLEPISCGISSGVEDMRFTQSGRRKRGD